MVWFVTSIDGGGGGGVCDGSGVGVNDDGV